MFDASPITTGDVTDEMHTYCTGPLNASYSDVEILGGCNGTGTIMRSWTVTDCNGVVSLAQIQTITVSDTTKPTLTFCPADPAPITLPDMFNTDPVGANTPQDPILDPSIFGTAIGMDKCAGTTISYQYVLIRPTPENCPTLYKVQERGP